ncbi:MULTISPECIES: HrpV family type III secretion system protein [Dickeya]|nr:MULTISPECIES: HrpV family type III secretion system protein [Dickeya]
MTDTLLPFSSAASWMAALARHQPGRWSPQPGVELVCQPGEAGWEVMLHIQPAQQPPGLLRTLLNRRYQQAERYEGSHLCLNGRNVLIIWWPLPQEPASYAQVVEQLFALAGLPPAPFVV